MVAKGVEVKKIIEKVEALWQEYNKLNQVHFKTHNDLKALRTNLDQLTKDYGKMENISVQQEKNILVLNTCLQQWES